MHENIVRKRRSANVWRVALKPGVWIAPSAGDPGCTIDCRNAEIFMSRQEAEAALEAARKYGPFCHAVVEIVSK